MYQFALEAGPPGHFVQDYDPNCYQFYACEAPGETDAQYEARVVADLNTGLAEITAPPQEREHRGMGGARTAILATPSAQSDCTRSEFRRPGRAGCNPKPPASSRPPSLRTPSQNGVLNQRFRFDVQGWMTEAEFEAALTSFVSAGSFNA